MNSEQPSPPAKSPPTENSVKPPPPPAANPPDGGEHYEGTHWLTWVLIGVVVFLGIGALVLLRGKKSKTPPPPPVSITVTNVRQGDINVAVKALGSVQPVYTATMTPRVDGQVITVNYKEGQIVASNDLLALIDPGPYQAAYLQASGQLERDTNLLAGAKIDWQRYQAAFAKDAIAKQLVDDQEALVHQDEGTVKFDEGQVAAAKVNLDYCYIRAPFPGRVGLRLVDPGNVVHAANSNAMVIVAQLQPITVVFNVAEDYLPEIQEQLKDGHEITVEAWDRSDEKIIATGKFLALDNLIDSSTGTIKIRAIFDNKDLTLFPNQFVNAKLIIKTLHNLNLIPTYAIQQNPEGAFVYLLTNQPPANTNRVAGENAGAGGGAAETNASSTNAPAGKISWVTMRNITAGTADNDTTAVTEGLQEGETVALDNFNKLGEGVKVVSRQPGQSGEGSKRGGKHQGGSHAKSPTDEAKDNSKDNSKDNP